MQKQPAKRGAGRPKAIIDWEYVGKMLEAGGFATGIAATIGCDEATLYRRCELDNKVSFATFRQQKVAKGDEQLRVKQFKTAMSDRQGSVTMQIWLGKQRLNQSDKSEITGKDGKDLIPEKFIVEVVENDSTARKNKKDQNQ
jgi:hypothetical protein